MEAVGSYFQFEKLTHCDVGIVWRREMRVGEDRSRVKGRDEGSCRLG